MHIWIGFGVADFIRHWQVLVCFVVVCRLNDETGLVMFYLVFFLILFLGVYVVFGSFYIVTIGILSCLVTFN